MATNLNYEKAYKYLWNRVQITIDLLRSGKATHEQLINLLELAQSIAEEKCIEE